MNHEDDRILPLLSNIQTCVCLKSDKTDQFEPRVDIFVEITRRLLEAVKQFVDFQHFWSIACIPLRWIDENIVVRFKKYCRPVQVLR